MAIGESTERLWESAHDNTNKGTVLWRRALQMVKLQLLLYLLVATSCEVFMP
jgi:hypothetical protein